MSMQDAKRFVEETAKDQKLMEQVKAVGIGDEEDGATFFARAAKDFGFDFTAEEINEALKAQQEAGMSLVDGAELDEEELDQIAGGWCWFDNKCSKAINYKKKNPECNSTYVPGEYCLFTDECDANSYYY